MFKLAILDNFVVVVTTTLMEVTKVMVLAFIMQFVKEFVTPFVNYFIKLLAFVNSEVIDDP